MAKYSFILLHKAYMKGLLSTHLSECGLSQRTLNSLSAVSEFLHEEGIFTVGELVKQCETDLLKRPGFGIKSYEEVRDFVRELGLHFEYETDRFLKEE